ncbi:hypothetical protein GBA52_011616 [Prunus armeniaca]|nr:hypothetical protein GBA52_011616 [Prunus armeniaca]
MMVLLQIQAISVYTLLVRTVVGYWHALYEKKRHDMVSSGEIRAIVDFKGEDLSVEYGVVAPRQG